MAVKRGDVVLVSVDDAAVDEPAVRPHVVVQSDVGNEHGATTVVVPLTTDFGEDRYPHEALLKAQDGPLAESAVALCSQPRTVLIDAEIVELLGSVPEDVLLDLDRALEYALDLGGPIE